MHGEYSRKREALQLSTGKRGDQPARKVAQTNRSKGLITPNRDFFFIQAEVPRAERDLIEYFGRHRLIIGALANQAH